MRLFSFQRPDGQKRVGILKDSSAKEYLDLNELDPTLPKSLLGILESPEGLKRVTELVKGHNNYQPLINIKFMPLVDRPGKIVCLGLNYADHAKEGGHARPEYPGFFMRGPSSLTAHQASIVLPKVSDKLDYEAELAFVVGKTARHLNKDNALDCIAGYSLFNDGSIRDYQRKTAQWTIGKNFDKTGAFGPWLVTPDELPKAADGLRIQSRLNGCVMQDANTKDFLWGIVETLILITECMTLEPGDVVITGTPAGVGYARTPPVFMKQGDQCEIEIEGIGILSNTIELEI